MYVFILHFAIKLIKSVISIVMYNKVLINIIYNQLNNDKISAYSD